MSTPNDDALRCADWRRIANHWSQVSELQAQAIARLIAENTAQRELLRQAVEALDCLWINDYCGLECSKRDATKVDAAIAAINEYLKEQK